MQAAFTVQLFGSQLAGNACESNVLEASHVAHVHKLNRPFILKYLFMCGLLLFASV